MATVILERSIIFFLRLVGITIVISTDENFKGEKHEKENNRSNDKVEVACSILCGCASTPPLTY
jgi:hypothetical protein